MKKTILMLMLAAASCGTPDEKLNSSTNGTTGTNGMTNGGSECTFDADCDFGEACESQRCVLTCSGDADCRGGEECREGVTTSLNVCAPIEPLNVMANNVTTTNGMTNGDTNGSTNNSANSNQSMLLYTIQIRSTTSNPEQCQVPDPGPDIFGVALEDSTGAVLGFGQVDWEQIQLEGNEQSDVNIIDGSAPDLGADSCPDMFDGNVVSLGCEMGGSWIVVSFVGVDGAPVALNSRAEQHVRVYEWGGQCTTGSVDDTYTVEVCLDTMGARAGDVSSCTIQLVLDGAGEVTAEVQGW